MPLLHRSMACGQVRQSLEGKSCRRHVTIGVPGANSFDLSADGSPHTLEFPGSFSERGGNQMMSSDDLM